MRTAPEGLPQTPNRHDVPVHMQKSLPDISTNRSAQKWTRREFAGRIAWELLRFPLFALSPRPFWGWRRILLRMFGARIGQQVHIYPSARIAIPWNVSIGDYAAVGEGAILYSLGPIAIGERATISQYAHLCAGTHDYRDPAMPLVKTHILIGAGAWICADAFVGPNVRIGEGAIVGARGVVINDIVPGMIVAGNPAREIGKRN